MIMKIGILKTVQDPRKGLNPGKEKSKVKQGLQTYDGSLCKVLPAQSLCTISQSTRRWIFFNMHNADSFCEQCWTRPLRISCRTPTYTCMTTPWRRNCSSGADMWPTPHSWHPNMYCHVDKACASRFLYMVLLINWRFGKLLI